MKLEDYNFVNQYITDRIDTDYLLLNETEKFSKINKYMKELYKLTDVLDYMITECDNHVIIFCLITEEHYNGNDRKWFNFNVSDLLIKKRKMKLDKIISVIG